MATLNIVIAYRPPISRAGLVMLTLLSPAWLILPIADMMGCLGSAGYAFLTAPMVFVGLSLVVAAWNKSIIISQQGICFPTGMTVGLKGRRHRSWSELKKVSVRNLRATDSDAFDKELTLTYAGEARATIKLAEIPVEMAEQLLLAVRTFGQNYEGQAIVEQAQEEIAAKCIGSDATRSYTQLWEEELRYRYTSTTFIPLSPSDKLQDGDIKVIRHLGLGGLSAVYLVQRLGRDLAVLKEYNVPADVDGASEQKAMEMFNREAQLLARLDHPGIAKVYDHFIEKGRHYLLLQYIHGQDLRQRVQEKGPLAEPVVLDYASQVAEILDYLHGCDPPIIHRDLTPENLVIDDHGKIVLVDFGAANEFLQTATGTLVGKHCYIAPEQFRGKATRQSDIYAFGGTLFYLLTGSDPVALSCSSPIALVPSVSAELDKLIAEMTAMDLGQRTMKASDVTARLKQLASQR